MCSPDVDSLDEGVERPCLMMTIPRNEPREHRTSNDLGSEVLPGISRVSSSLPWGPGAPAAPFSFFLFHATLRKKSRGRRFFRTVGTGMCHRLSCCANVGGTFVRRSPTMRWMMLKKCSTLLSRCVQRSRNCLLKPALLSKKIGATILAYSALQKRHGGTRRQL